MEPEDFRPRFSWISIWPIVVALLINSIAMVWIYARLKTPEPVPPPTDEISTQQHQQILEELVSIHKQINQTAISQPQTITPILGTNTDYTGQLSDLLADQAKPDYITIASSQNSKVDVYKENASFSPVVDQIIYGQKYPFSTKLNNWYLITLPSGKVGWVNSAYVKEVSPGQ